MTTLKYTVNEEVAHNVIQYLEGHNHKSLDVIMAEKGDEISRFKFIANSMTNAHAMTITFTDKMLFQYTEKYLLSEIHKVLKSTKNINNYVFVNDISINGRFHLHGVIEFKKLTTITTLRRKLSKYGMTKVKHMDNIPKWVNYCVEQYTEPIGKKGVKLSPLRCTVIHA